MTLEACIAVIKGILGSGGPHDVFQQRQLGLALRQLDAALEGTSSEDKTAELEAELKDARKALKACEARCADQAEKIEAVKKELASAKRKIARTEKKAKE